MFSFNSFHCKNKNTSHTPHVLYWLCVFFSTLYFDTPPTWFPLKDKLCFVSFFGFPFFSVEKTSFRVCLRMKFQCRLVQKKNWRVLIDKNFPKISHAIIIFAHPNRHERFFFFFKTNFHRNKYFISMKFVTICLSITNVIETFDGINCVCVWIVWVWWMVCSYLIPNKLNWRGSGMIFIAERCKYKHVMYFYHIFQRSE